MNFFAEHQLAIINCMTGARAVASKWPFIIGGGEACDLALEVNGSSCEIAPSGRGYVFNVLADNGSVLLNGAPNPNSPLKKETKYSLKVGDHLFVSPLPR